jgi:hypothetical protein
VPDGAQLLALTGPGVVGRDYAAVLAVDDPEAALRDLAGQMADGMEPSSGAARPEPRREDLPSGEPIWVLDHSVQGGGGACGAQASPDGRAVLVVPFSD